jgi:hypothetical protein
MRWVREKKKKKKKKKKKTRFRGMREVREKKKEKKKTRGVCRCFVLILVCAFFLRMLRCQLASEGQKTSPFYTDRIATAIFAYYF